MSVATVTTMVAFAVLVILSIGYRTGRARAAWRDVRAVRRDLPAKRRVAWAHTRGLALGAALLVGALLAAGWTAGH